MSNRLTAVAVVALVVLAGCSGGLPGGDGASGAGDGGEAADLPPVTEQPWAAENESVDYETLTERHSAVLANASAYEFSHEQFNEDGSGTEATVAVDRDADRVYFDATSTTGSENAEQVQETYVADGTIYAKSGTDGEFTYSTQNASAEEVERFVTQQSRLGATGGVVDALEFEYRGVEDGQYRFEADSIAASDRTSFDVDNVVEASGTLVVDEDGYVAELSLSLTIETDDGQQQASLSYETTGVGETTVEEPAWTDEAS